MCGPELINEDTMQKIAAYRAASHSASASPFGPDDETGMPNLVTPAAMRSILEVVDLHKVIDLSVDYFVGMPSWNSLTGDNPFQIWMSHTPRGQVNLDDLGVGRAANELVSYSGDAISMYTHTGTHLDALNHFGYHGRIWNGFTAEEHLGSRHWTVAGADKQPPVIARGLLIDVAGLHGQDMLDDGYGIGAADLQEALARQGSEVRPGDVVLIRTGRMRAWPDGDRYQMNAPGLTRGGAEFLARAGAVIIGGDNSALEQMPTDDPENWLPVHTYLLAEAGVPIMEVVDCEELAAERLYEFAYIGACLRIRGATAAPIRPLALPLRR
jgi:kynurenine formamidase